MCVEVKRIKEEYQYDFSSLLINEKTGIEAKNKINTRLEEMAETLLNNILDNKNYKIEAIKDNAVAIPIIGISNHFGFLNYDTDFDSFADGKYKNASGLIIISNEMNEILGSDKVLLLSDKETLEHSRFTIAHELGHYLFDFNEKKDYQFINFYRTEDTFKNSKEIRASRFAAALLMPQGKFIEEYNKVKESVYYDRVNILAKIFIVSPTAIDLRIKELKELNLI